MRPSRSGPEFDVELDRCIDQLLVTGSWQPAVAPGRARTELDSLMRVASLVRSLSRYITRPSPRQKARVWASVSDRLNLWKFSLRRHCDRIELSRPIAGGT